MGLSPSNIYMNYSVHVVTEEGQEKEKIKEPFNPLTSRSYQYISSSCSFSPRELRKVSTKGYCLIKHQILRTIVANKEMCGHELRELAFGSWE